MNEKKYRNKNLYFATLNGITVINEWQNHTLKDDEESYNKTIGLLPPNNTGQPYQY